MIAPNEEFARSLLSNISAVTKKFNIVNKPRAKKLLFPCEGKNWRDEGKLSISKALYGNRPPTPIGGKHRNLWRILGLPKLEVEIYLEVYSDTEALAILLRDSIRNNTVLLPARDFMHRLNASSDAALVEVFKGLKKKYQSMCQSWRAFIDRNDDVQEQFDKLGNAITYDNICDALETWSCEIYEKRLSSLIEIDTFHVMHFANMLTVAICEKILSTEPHKLRVGMKPIYHNTVIKALDKAAAELQSSTVE